MRLLDPRFRYIPAAATDVAATWQRFGFNPRANVERRARLKQALSEAQTDDGVRPSAIFTLVKAR